MRCNYSIFGRTSLPVENEHILLRSQIDELKTSLEQAQVQRRRKMEYDLIAEKINALPSREELEQCVHPHHLRYALRTKMSLCVIGRSES